MTTKTNLTAAEQLAKHFSKRVYGDLTQTNQKAVKRLLLDYIGVAISGSQTKSGEIARKFAGLAGGKEESQLIGGPDRVPAIQAAFANAISSHSV